MSKLTQLPNGDWLDPTTVVGIRAFGRSRCETTKTVFPPRVVVETSGVVKLLIVHCEDYQSAETLRDNLAQVANHGGNAIS